MCGVRTQRCARVVRAPLESAFGGLLGVESAHCRGSVVEARAGALACGLLRHGCMENNMKLGVLTLSNPPVRTRIAMLFGIRSIPLSLSVLLVGCGAPALGSGEVSGDALTSTDAGAAEASVTQDAASHSQTEAPESVGTLQQRVSSWPDRLLGLPQCGLGGPCQQLNINGELVSSNGLVTLIMQGDGNLVLYRNDGGAPPAIWATNTWNQPCNVAVMQSDGNFVVYDPSGRACWATGTWGHPGAYVVLQDDGNLVVYEKGGVSLWASNTVLANDCPGPQSFGPLTDDGCDPGSPYHRYQSTLNNIPSGANGIDTCYCTLGPQAPVWNQTPGLCTQAHFLWFWGSVSGIWDEFDPSCCASEGLTLCGGSCVRCPAGGGCVNGGCACPPGEVGCNGSCTPLNTQANCGGCGNACPAGGSCVNGTCRCPAGQSNCGGTCTTLNTQSNCGSCGNSCPAGGSCVNGTCKCPPGEVNCGGLCSSLRTMQNCGRCGNSCPAGGKCVNEICECGFDQYNCAGTCCYPNSCLYNSQGQPQECCPYGKCVDPLGGAYCCAPQ
jgi:hypothetical protein